MNILVLASKPVDAGSLRDALPGEDLDDAHVLVAPALNSSPIAFWMSDSDEAIAEAKQVAAESLRSLDSAGVDAVADTGESEPLLAIQDALATFDADRVVVFIHDEEEQRYREDDVVGEVDRRFGIPVTQIVV